VGWLIEKLDNLQKKESKYNKIAAVSKKASLVRYYHKNYLSTNNVKSVGMIH